MKIKLILAFLFFWCNSALANNNIIYLALSKQRVIQNNLKVVANNSANLNTIGFKEKKLVVNSYGNHMKKSDVNFVYDGQTFRNLKQGAMNNTANPLDLAILGDGYFEIQTPKGLRYSRAGNFTLDRNGILSTNEGYKVNSENGGEINASGIKNIEFDELGNYYFDGSLAGKIKVATFANPRLLKEEGANLLVTNQPVRISSEFQLAQGFLEESNANPIQQTMDLIDVQRDAELISKIINDKFELTRNLGKIVTN